MQTLKNTYNAIETMHWKIFYTEAPIDTIEQWLNNAKFIEVWNSLIATNQVIEVRPANGPEYFEKFVLPNLSRSIAPKIKSWLAELEKKPPTIEQIQAKIDYLQSEETKPKSFDIKRRFVTWIWNNTSTNSYSQPKKNLVCKL